MALSFIDIFLQNLTPFLNQSKETWLAKVSINFTLNIIHLKYINCNNNNLNYNSQVCLKY